MRTLYNLEYVITDKLDRAKKKFHVGVFKTEEEVELAKQEVSKNVEEGCKILFNVYVSENIF